MISIYDKIFSKIKDKRNKRVFVTKDFLGIANRTSTDKALSTLANHGILRRLARGIYDYPIIDPELGMLPPNLDQVVEAIGRQTGDIFQVDGAKAANILGLSTQVPAQRVYLTNGRTRNVKIGSWIIQFKHAGPKALAGAGQISGYVLQALRYLGKQNIDDCVIQKITEKISEKDKKKLKQLISYAPGWVYSSLQKITKGN